MNRVKGNPPQAAPEFHMQMKRSSLFSSCCKIQPGFLPTFSTMPFPSHKTFLSLLGKEAVNNFNKPRQEPATAVGSQGPELPSLPSEHFLHQISSDSWPGYRRPNESRVLRQAAALVRLDRGLRVCVLRASPVLTVATSKDSHPTFHALLGIFLHKDSPGKAFTDTGTRTESLSLVH